MYLVGTIWGEYTNQAVSRWKIEYNDNWMGYRGVYAWKPLKGFMIALTKP